MKKLMLFPILIVLIVVFGAGVGLWANQSFRPVSVTEKYGEFVIPKGASAGVVANKLEKEGYIRSALAFKLYSQFSGISKGIFAGEYKISPHMTLPQIASTLTSGPLEVWVTIPEGLRREEVAEKFIQGLNKKGDDAASFRSDFLSASKELEGYLFPDTYLFPNEASASAVVKRMKTTFDNKIEDYKDNISKSKLSQSEIVTLASILERETKTDQERPMVAGVILNRLDIGMGLQVDATVQYAKGTADCRQMTANCEWWKPLLRDDLDLNSPYNTYKFRGLPPGPIANPGLSSLKAAILPEENDYLYYLHDSSGQIHYAKTLEEHNANVSKYLGK